MERENLTDSKTHYEPLQPNGIQVELSEDRTKAVFTSYVEGIKVCTVPFSLHEVDTLISLIENTKAQMTEAALA